MEYSGEFSTDIFKQIINGKGDRSLPLLACRNALDLLASRTANPTATLADREYWFKASNEIQRLITALNVISREF